jgi:hypothetical protein
MRILDDIAIMDKLCNSLMGKTKVHASKCCSPRERECNRAVCLCVKNVDIKRSDYLSNCNGSVDVDKVSVL